MRHYYLGLAANYSKARVLMHTFAVGRESDRKALHSYLAQKYNGSVILTKNGRSALALAFKAYFEPGDGVIVNGFTCYAVYEAIKAAKLVPVWADISRGHLNFDVATLDNAIKQYSETGLGKESKSETSIKGIVIQNSLGNPVDVAAIEKFAKQHGLTIIEDLAHCAGIRYSDGREAGTVGAAVAFSFGKEKMVDAISGGAVVLRTPLKAEIKVPSKSPKVSDTLRARFYPVFGVVARGLSHVHLGGAWMRALVKIHWVEKSADNKLDITRKIAKFEAKMALKQFETLKNTKHPLRKHFLVKDRRQVLKDLRDKGYYFDGLWYERPVSPERYYKKVHFPEEKCPTATEVAQKIVNLPTYYTSEDLADAEKIINKYREEQC